MKIQLRNGAKLKCEPKDGNTQKTDNYEALKCLMENAWFFYHHRDRIYADSRLFLAQTPIRLCHDGWTFVYETPQPESDEDRSGCMMTLGGLLERWEHDAKSVYKDDDGKFGLIFQVSYRYSSIHYILPDGRICRKEVFNPNLFKPDARTPNHVYAEAAEKSKTLTLFEVKEQIAKELGTDRLDPLALEVEQLKFANGDLQNQLSQRDQLMEIQRARQHELFLEICYHRKAELQPRYEACMAIKAEEEKERERIDEELRRLRHVLRHTGDSAVQARYQTLKRERRELKDEYGERIDNESIFRLADPITAMRLAEEYEASIKDTAAEARDSQTFARLRRIFTR